MSGRAQVRSKLRVPSDKSRSEPAFPPKAARQRFSSPKASAFSRGAGRARSGKSISAAEAFWCLSRVKARERFDDAAWSVTDRQRLRIAAAAEAWLARYADTRIHDIRFDAILVAPGRIPRHITSAFEAAG